MAKTKTLRREKKRWKRRTGEAATFTFKLGKALLVAPYVLQPDGELSFLSIDLVTRGSDDVNKRVQCMSTFNEMAPHYNLGISLRPYSLRELPQFIDSAYSTLIKRRRYLNCSSSGALVLASLLNKDKYPTGGKSVNLLAAEFARLFYDDPSHYGKRCSDSLSAFVRHGLRDLIKAGIVVQGFSGAFFFKPDYRDLMTAQGIAYLPKFHGKSNV